MSMRAAIIGCLVVTIGTINAVPFYGDFMHHLTPPHSFMQAIPLDPLPPLEPLPQASSAAYPHFWQQQFANPNPNPLHTVPSNFAPNPEFLSLEEQQQRARTEAPPFSSEKNFDVDVVTGELGGPKPSIFFRQSFPFLGNDFFNSFGGFGIGAGPHQEPWWKGPNVCTEKEESESEDRGSEAETTETEITPEVSETLNFRPSLFGQFQFSLNSCVEKPNKYVCTKIVSKNGKKKTLTITRQCCHGYGRARNADFATPCEKIDIKNIEETAVELGAKDFIATGKNNGLTETLANRKNITIFMPTDGAFNSFSEQTQSENNVVDMPVDGSMKNLFLRHVVDGEISLYDVTNDQLLKTHEEGQTIRMNTYPLPPFESVESVRYTANCVPIVKHDRVYEQGLVHTLGGVLKNPVKMNVMDLIRQRADMSIMRTVLEKTKLSELLEGEKPVTIFVPTDDAFDKLEPHLRRALKEGKGCASNILKNHILDLTFCSAASIVGAKTTAYNLLGEPLRFNRSTASTGNSEVADLLSKETVSINDQAKIIESDIMGTNGVMHVIDTILPTHSALPLSTLMQEKNVTIFKRLLEAAGLDNQFDDMDNITLFAPTDKALQGTKWANLLDENPDQLKNNAELLAFLNYHVVAPMTKTCDLAEQLMPTIGGGSVRINLYSTHSLFSNVMNRATVNCARLVHFDDESCGSVLHQVDKPLIAPKMNLLQVLESNPAYSRFLELVRAANLTSVLTNVEEGYTLLVPKNDVFAEVDDWEKNLTKDPQQLENLIKTHIVNDVVCCAGIIPTNWPFVRSIEALNGAHLRITRDRRPKVENAGVTKCDNVATNGIIHEINDVIVPPRRPQEHPEQHFPHPAQHFGDLFF